MTRGIPYSFDTDEALQHAAARVNRFKGHPPLLPEPLLFTQQAVLDALVVAPAPVTESWVNGSLAAVSGITRWVHNTGQPLTRQHVFSEETRYRWVDGAGHLTKESARIYAVRLELIADHLNGATVKRLPRATKVQEAPVQPLTPTQEADLWTWTRGLRPLTRRQRMQGSIVTGLGLGLTRGEKYLLTKEDVTVTDDGVLARVTNPLTGVTRTVACRRDWEERLATLVFEMKPGHYVLAPWRDTRPSPQSADESMRRAHKARPPVDFNNVRLRNTWLCHHLAAGTPLKVLMAAADMAEANHLHNLLTLLPDVSDADAYAALRGRA
ncbi:hypothetical protein ACFP3Q_06305 [Nocardioides sp. GCM10027113]|uniref:hypothetical protein n=1 Tax=unclassified Nocardioides TaxID=2615069 RepID=UPI00360D6F9A